VPAKFILCLGTCAHVPRRSGGHKSERQIKEQTNIEDRKNNERTQTMIDNHKQKIKSCKKHSEEAEAIAALNLSKHKPFCTTLAIRSEEADDKRAFSCLSIQPICCNKGNLIHTL
jgi:hypothetical protein